VNDGKIEIPDYGKSSRMAHFVYKCNEEDYLSRLWARNKIGINYVATDNIGPSR
jgi:hypothetical protein